MQTTEEKFTDEQLAWIASRPKKVQAVISKCPPNTCYRGADGNGHYALYSYEENKSGKVSMKVVHGKDSFMAGFTVVGMSPDDIVKCGCGKWEPVKED